MVVVQLRSFANLLHFPKRRVSVVVSIRDKPVEKCCQNSVADWQSASDSFHNQAQMLVNITQSLGKPRNVLKPSGPLILPVLRHKAKGPETANQGAVYSPPDAEPLSKHGDVDGITGGLE